MLNTTPDTLTAWFAEARERDLSGIRGKFHSHITVQTADQGRLQAFCRERRIKVTIIELSDFSGRHQRDVMTTQHYRIDTPDAVARIVDQLDALCGELSAAGFAVVRVKLEHESLPTLKRFTGANYREAHLKLHIEPERYEEVMSWLRAQAPRLGYVPSRNPLAVSRGRVVQFVNMRLYEGTLADTDQRIDAVAEAIRDHGVHVGEVKRETTVFDSNLELDRWWA